MIVGFEELSTIDYPNIPASVVYFWGCNLRCPYCYNADLVTGSPPSPFSIEDIVLKIEKASRFIDGVVLTGGEPLLYPGEVIRLSKAIHDLGLKVKLDTNGLTDLNATLISGNLIEQIAPDYIAMDVKADYDGYRDLASNHFKSYATPSLYLKENLEFLKNSNIDYELRTTMVFPFVNRRIFPAMAKMVSGAKLYVLQKARLDHIGISDFVGMESLDNLEKWRKLFKPYVDKVEIRE